MSTVRRAAIVLAAVSGLALTACGPTEGDAAGGGGGATVSPTKSATPSKSAAPSASPDKDAPSAADGSSPDPDYDVFPCSTYDVKFTATLAESTTSSYLLKITNKGAKACKALGHPVVTFGDLDGQATERGGAPGIEDAIRLEPGESAYAGLMGGVNDGTGETVNSIAMTMNTESDLEQTPLKASTPGLYVSPDQNSVAAWMGNAEDALSS
ncbi:DUF4232 domain-containing protein [Streptomyces ipomoeae]|uniref:DUF4232 domain-containing protein n=1 Tax=Streptomyces ipomoeae TaxID=103232 RepID=UPI00114677D3|nr:DUF4232 domain-containing protein [Streptomyces ipomoeae]MDX2825283.1 DUF4232 domain-containing protein [Streptomyces ipomoeae]MDX2877217.1 DUF4232 domain-containing protein [Streptomyces ipomoeae]TQE32797.1 DUF4232 domain-containing protein [Streptomyces ipomoeae]